MQEEVVATNSSTPRAPRSQFDQLSPLILLAAFLGIPGLGAIALVLTLQIPRVLYGETVPILLAAEIVSLVGVLFLVVLLRFTLSQPSAPKGLFRNILDFLAMAGWHPAVTTALACILILPQVWYLRSDHYWLIDILRRRGWQAMQSVDVQAQLDGIIAAFQLSLTGGVPLLFTLHMFTRWKPRNRWLPWLLIPVLIVGTAIGVIILVTIGHA
jgi:hypothetical protein